MTHAVRPCVECGHSRPIAGRGRCGSCYSVLWKTAHPGWLPAYRARHRAPAHSGDPQHWRLPQAAAVREREYQEHPGQRRPWIPITPAPVVSHDVGELAQLGAARGRVGQRRDVPIGALCLTDRGRAELAEWPYTDVRRWRYRRYWQ